MTFKQKLTQFQTAWGSLNTKIKTKLTSQQKTITESTTKLNEVNNKLELSVKENMENEKVLDQLMKEFKELEESLAQD